MNSSIVEGMYADQYRDSSIKNEIKQSYRKRFPEPTVTPVTHPWKFDPLNPPQGWRYDPYYELWLEEKNK